MCIRDRLYDWLAPLISRTTHGVSLPDSIGDLVSRLRRRRSRDDEDGDDDDDDELDDEAAALLSILSLIHIYGIGMSVSGRGGIWVRIACSCS